jgi:formylglycine-generating enzyme required for sulfatase activity
MWVKIPTGEVTLTHAGGYVFHPVQQKVEAFEIAKYPVTVAEFQAFIDASDCFADSQWWDYSDAARLWRLENDQPLPLDFSEDDHPRTHITWYEAVAYCQWMTHKTDELIRLPTEAEWQLAAQGQDGRVYPWGNEWSVDYCHNNLEQQSIGTKSVTAYEGKGNSPYGVVDMIGNVWEWCGTNWNSGKYDVVTDDVRVLRGGSWFDNVMNHFRVTFRSSWNPSIASDLRGFRVVRSGKLT